MNNTGWHIAAVDRRATNTQLVPAKTDTSGALADDTSLPPTEWMQNDVSSLTACSQF